MTTKQTIERGGVTYNFSEGRTIRGEFPTFTRLEMAVHSPAHPHYGRRVVLSVMPHGGMVYFARIEGDTWSTAFECEDGYFEDVKVAREWVEALRDFNADLDTRIG